MGCTPFEVVRNIMLPYIRKSAIGAVMLGLGRALGETMAVTFIIGNSHAFPKSLFDSGSTIASTIANEFTEATGDHAYFRADRARPGAVHDHLRNAGRRPAAARPGDRVMASRAASSGSRHARRKLVNYIFVGLTSIATLIALAALVMILWTLFAKGFGGINAGIFTQDQPGGGSEPGRWRLA